jgi:hypothetical protein
MKLLVASLFVLVGSTCALGVDERPSRPLLERVEVLGASVSAGRGLRVGLTDALRATWTNEPAVIESHADRHFFLKPLEKAKRQVDAALEGDPSLVVGVDFLFWLGYGASGPDGAALKSEDERLALLERGLAELERVPCTLVVGDFPDMSASIGHMLLKSQVPATATLARLNARLREWAGSRPNVVVVSLAELVAGMRAERAVTFGATKFAPEETSRWLQRDRLHTTERGLAAVALAIDVALVEAGRMESEEHRTDLGAIVERMRERREAALAR